MTIIFCCCLLSRSLGSILTDTIRPNSLLYNGVEYTKGVTYNNESPFFGGDDFFKGDLTYYGNFYKGLDLQYDCQDDVVLLKYPFGEKRIQLIKEKLEAFSLGEHKFVKAPVQGAGGGFYEQLYKGKRIVLVQWQKRIVLNLSQQERYEMYKSIYLFDGKNSTRITKASELLNLMGDRKKGIRQFYHDNRLSFKKDPEKAVVLMVEKAESEGW
jgi:hypothetical protein